MAELRKAPCWLQRFRSAAICGIVVGCMFVAAPAWSQTDEKILGTIIDPIDDIVDDVVDDVDDVVDDVVDVVDEVLTQTQLDAFLDEVGLGGLVDEALSLSLLNGDSYEPDNSPMQAVWSGLTLLDDVLGQVGIRNFHTDGDVDWVAFHGAAGHKITVQTIGLFLTADTYVRVYRQLQPGETLPDPWPSECPKDLVPGPGGTTLVPVGCNDNADFPLGTLRSNVEFIAPQEGMYYVAVAYSPLAILQTLLGGKSAKSESPSSGPQTAYVLQTTYTPTESNSILLNNLFCTMAESGSNTRLTEGKVVLKPHNIVMRRNQDGVYPCTGLPDDRYTIEAEAPGYEDDSLLRHIWGGRTYSETFRLKATAEPDPEPETELREGWTGHASDYLEPYGRLTLSEVVRLIQLYNSGGFHCSEATDDGFDIGPGATSCAPHSADYRPQNFKIELQELLRVIQFFNARALVPCSGSEDGFCIP